MFHDFDDGLQITQYMGVAFSMGHQCIAIVGSVWIGIYPVQNRVKLLKKVFNISENVIPLSIVYIGYPAEEKEPRTRYDDKRVYWQEYEPTRKHRSKDKPLIGHY